LLIRLFFLAGIADLCPLEHAVYNASTAIIEELVKHGAHFHQNGIGIETYLAAKKDIFEAIEDGDLKTVKMFLDIGVNPSVIKGKPLKWSPLWCAVYYNNLEISKLLIEKGADIECCCDDYYYDNKNEKQTVSSTPLCIAAKQGNLDLINLLIEKGAKINGAWFGSPLLHAIEADQWAAVRLLIEKGVDIHKGSLCDAAARGSMQIMELLIAKGAIVNPKESWFFETTYPPIFPAIANNRLAAVQLLIEHGADVSTGYYSETPLMSACKKGYCEIVKLLLDHGADVNVVNARDYNDEDKGKTALHYAAQSNGENVIKDLLECGAHVNSKAKNGKTALHYALDRNEKIVGVLLSWGAEVNAADKDGVTPLMLACKNGYKNYGYGEIVELLLHYGAHVDCKDKDSKTALHYAVQYGNKKIIKDLLDWDAHVNAKDKDAETPLFRACRIFLGFWGISDSRSGKIVHLLLNYGARIDDRTKNILTNVTFDRRVSFRA
jgi:ankyrin repeat protein